MTSGTGQQDSADGKGASTSSTSPAPSPKPTSTKGKVAWEVAAPAAEMDGRTVSAPGAWLSGTTYATGVSDGVTGYDVASGTEKWSIPLSGDICQASPTRTSAGYVAVAHRTSKQDKSPCTQFAVIDITKGHVVWRAALKTALRPLGLSMTVAVTDQVAAIGWPTVGSAAGGSFGFELNTGRSIWTAPAPGCDGDEHAGGKVLVTHSLCGGDWEGGTHRVGHRDPVTGKVTWRYTTRATEAWIVSADPLIVGVNSGLPEEDTPDRLVSVSTQGKVQAIWKSKDTYSTGCTSQRRRCGGVLATPGTLYLATHDSQKANSIYAFDTVTGKRKWTYTPVTHLSRVLVPVQADNDGLTVHMRSTSNRGSEVIRLAGLDGKPTQLMKMPDTGYSTTPDYEMVDDSVEDPLHYADYRLFVHRRGMFNYFIDAPMTMVLTNH
ncbi:PQQ-binding-like beta-propeller repeat protein [Streptomyces sp. MS1.AVA.4]|uniref:PQQ-binding-like beta-propeller repeat protein n=1 Tax=Streptomyces pratisoli TaxID=3139917 RepID=A0ACC6QVB2_9ACTN